LNPSVSVEAPGSSDTTPVVVAPVPSRPSTRPQHGISKPKIYTDDTARYGLFTSSGENRDLCEALGNEKWKRAMDVEFDALQKNGTWHLVPTLLIANGCIR
jgi:hypothetical protein